MRRKASRSTSEELVVRAAELAVRAWAGAAPYVERARVEAAPLVQRARVEAEPLVARVQVELAWILTAAAPLVEQAVETLTVALEDAGQRGGAAWAALTQVVEPEPVEVRRWPWALGAAVAGAAAGTAVAFAMEQVRPPDAPGALDPAEVQAVVDRPEVSAAPR